MKNRFKKALFAFFKDEILDAVKYNPLGNYETQVTVVSKTLNFEELKCEIAVSDRMNGDPRAYENSLREARTALIDKAMEFIQVDEQSVFDPNIYDERRIRCSLFVGKTER
jgi:hypothetical protein